MPNSKSFIVKTFTKCPAGQSLLKSLYKDDYDKNVLDTTTDKDKIKTVDLGDGYTNIEKYINGISTKHKVDWRDLKNNYDTLEEKGKLM